LTPIGCSCSRGDLGELNQDRFDHVTVFIADQPSVAQIENQELQLADGAMPYFEKWFGEAFNFAHAKVIEALNGMDWSIPASPSHKEMREQFGRLVGNQTARRAAKAAIAVSASQEKSTPKTG